ncbi:serine/threonine protein phosphatase [Altererythrobacter salegens]|uniref:Serine/threonine protein phosphatase n=1 Tax=Croceibacterium salegens TaxID=1737568 RepID=A0A6I4SU65_9SPHN|nr:metallophosphoesterase family protein [Croceibacterium salegens]MXO59481.1 serine/threonine protein phosphatase [Croceibacterium salegens]
MNRYFSRRDRLATTLPTTADEERIYAIGDVHGRLDLLEVLMQRLEQDSRFRDDCPTRLILLGDLIDRGPDSRLLLELAQRAQYECDRVTVLLGNHEDLLLESTFGNAAAQRAWLQHGGAATLRSYGLDVSEMEAASAEEMAAILCEVIGDKALAWMNSLPLYFQSGDYFFCHAGIRPGVPLSRQGRHDLLWIRKKFLSSQRDHGAVVVHGHSETNELVFARNRINVDTAAYRTGVLSAVGLQGTIQWYVSTDRDR